MEAFSLSVTSVESRQVTVEAGWATPLQGDFATGQRTLPNTGWRGDFATGARSTAGPLPTGTFATGLSRDPGPLTVGSFATGMSRPGADRGRESGVRFMPESWFGRGGDNRRVAV
jgi:hypothetical protein